MRPGGGKYGTVGRTCTGIVTRPDRTVLCLSYNGMECAQLPATAAYWSEWKGNRLAMLPCTLWDDVQNPRLFKGPAGYSPGRCRWIAKQNARLVHSGCWSVRCSPVAAGQYKSRRWPVCSGSLRLLQFNIISWLRCIQVLAPLGKRQKPHQREMVRIWIALLHHKEDSF